MFCGYRGERLIFNLFGAFQLYCGQSCSWVTSINQRLAPHFSSNLCTYIKLIPVILRNVWKTKQISTFFSKCWTIPFDIYLVEYALDMTFSVVVGFLVQPSDMYDRRGQWIEWGYSGLTNEKPWNSSWSRLAISSWSGGVSSGGWRVKKRSKFSASRPHCGGEREREIERGRWGEDGVNMMEWGMSRKKWTPNKQRGKKRKTTKTWHQPIKSVTAETVDFHWSIWKPVTFQHPSLVTTLTNDSSAFESLVNNGGLWWMSELD